MQTRLRQCLQSVVISKSIIEVIKPQKATIDISTWITYTNDQYQFSFQHPAEWMRNGICKERGTRAQKRTLRQSPRISELLMKFIRTVEDRM